MAIVRAYRGLVPRIGAGVYLADDVVVIGDVTLEDGVSVWWGSVLRGDCGAIRVGRGSNIQDGCMLHATTDQSTVVLGHDVSVGHHAVIHGAHVEEGALVGMKSVLLDRAVVGSYSIVAAGSVVPERMLIPPDTLVAGVPATVKRELETANRQARLAHAQQYRELALEHLRGSHAR
jgi:carbonic anhydrase/acetyltransferase-like protein (isoleucine patch superfamily)